MSRFPAFALAAFCVVSAVTAAEVDYLSQVKPLLTEKCYSCHGVLKQESNLRLDTRQLMLRGGDSGGVIVPGKPGASPMVERIRSSDSDRMPPHEQGSALTSDQVSVIENWIRQGAEAPDEAIPTSPEQHWAFQPIVRPPMPSDAAEANPIDLLLDAKHANRSLRAQGRAHRSLQLRRLYLDLIGLSPTTTQLSDSRPWPEIVDELLASPHHGERWARHWMDIWRYSDWYGLGDQLRNSQKHLWHWRDWIIDALNRDKGYDRMVLEMIAGDELAPDDPSVLAATGFLARNYYLFNRTTWLDNTIEHTSKAFLGLTVNCAKCHDHKYDPITQLDYYRLRAIFEPHQVRLDPIPGVTNFESDGLPRVFDDDVSIATYLHVRGDPQNPDRDREIKAGVPAILERFAPEIEPVPLPATAYAPGTRDYVRHDYLRQAESEVRAAEVELADARKKLSEVPLASTESEAAPAAEIDAFELVDEFDGPNPDLWKLVGDGWEYRDGALLQTVATRESHLVRLLPAVPRDFELNCRYTTTGGTTYKSMTIRFDQSEDDQYSNCVYTSAHEPGPKVQVSFSRSGQTTYPPEGRRGQKIEVGRAYHLRFAVRDTLVNVWLDGALLVAYRYPDRRDGFLSLSGFDATVAFDSIKVTSLSPAMELKEATSGASGSTADPKVMVSVAEAKLRSAVANLRSLEATLAADQARHGGAADEAAKPLARAAARLQAESQRATAEYRMLADASDAKKVEAARQQLASANEKLLSTEKGEGDYESFRASRKALESPADKETDYPPVYSPISTGRRLALARWLTSRENPLTARVAVNHVWLRHFGAPLVESVFDFGLRAPKPEQADLLDLLAAELIESGWSLKHLHRLMVTSEAYRRSSSTLDADPRCLDEDPANQFYWRMNPRRMESQVVRDSLLALSGQLDRTIGGPSLDHGHTPPRRSLYFKHSPDEQDKFLEMFDNADVLSCYRRSESIVPQQALALSNSQLAISVSQRIAESIQTSLPDPNRRSFIEAVFRLLLARQATEAEMNECERFLDELDVASRPNQNDRSRDRSSLVHAILNHNDFITIR